MQNLFYSNYPSVDQDEPLTLVLPIVGLTLEQSAAVILLCRVSGLDE
ncbi:MAG: hypothetical protein ABI675_30885 [Chitinophagaceae bacterium]